MRLLASRSILLAIIPALAGAQPAVEYEISFANAVHHEARITATWREVGDEPLTIRMSRSSAGRYALHEFGKNVYALSAVDGAGRPLEAMRRDPYSWIVAGHDGAVSVEYTLYADRVDGTYTAFDLTHAHMNMPATFLWADGFEKRPIKLRLIPPSGGGAVATQLAPTEDPYVFEAPDLQYFFDSPVELGTLSLRSWEVESGGRTQTLRLAVHHQGTEQDVDDLLEAAKKVVAAQVEIFGELPTFDFGTYTFIADYLPYAESDGMEHRNSTILTHGKSIGEDKLTILGDVSHEFFHAWNVERIRPADLEPFDFERSNMSDSLWFAEGFTSYYGNLAVRRAGESSIGDLSDAMSLWLNAVTNSPGRNFATPKGMSMQATFVDGASAIDPTNFSNTFLSYYSYGAAIALALDLTMRSELDGLGLDALMQYMWQTYGKPEKPYASNDIRMALAEVTGSERFAAEFFERYIDGSQLPDYAALLGNAGMAVRKANPGEAWAGPVSFELEGREAIVSTNSIIGSPLYDAGLDRGDRIVAVGGRKIGSQQDWDRAIERHAPGDRATIQYVQRGVERTAEIVFVEDPTLEAVPLEDLGQELGPAQLAFRSAWLGKDK